MEELSSTSDQSNLDNHDRKDKGRLPTESDLARKGICLVLNNQFEEAQALFQNRNESLQIDAAFCFVTLINALMTFEEDKLKETLSAFQQLEIKCSQDNTWFRSVKDTVFGSDSATDPRKLEEQIILADAQVFIALLSFLQQDIANFMKGSWVLRKAWKIYRTCYNQIFKLHSGDPFSGQISGCRKLLNPFSSTLLLDILKLSEVREKYRKHVKITGRYDLIFPDHLHIPSDYTWDEVCISRSQSVQNNFGSQNKGRFLGEEDSPSGSRTVTSGTPYPSSEPYRASKSNFKNKFYSLFSLTSESFSPIPSVELDEYSRLMAAVSFGYGTFQLCMSLLPAPILKVMNFLGFGSDRRSAIQALMYSKNSNDMRAPLAVLTLLWYYTIIQPLYEFDGQRSDHIEAAEVLIIESDDEFGKSALFLFFKGRIQRLKKNIPEAIVEYQTAIKCSPQREIKVLCFHEIGWCYLMECDWSNAHQVFLDLSHQSRWSKNFYSYLTAITAGALGQSKEVKIIRSELIRNYNSHSNHASTTIKQFGEFIWKRALKIEHTNKFCNRLLIYEMLYLWSALPVCSTLPSIINDCKEPEEENKEPMPGLRLLILGAALNYQGKFTDAVQCFKLVLSSRQELSKISDDAHISAFALYELSMILIKNGETVIEGKSNLVSLASTYKNYDFENRLNTKIQTALNTLENI